MVSGILIEDPAARLVVEDSTITHHLRPVRLAGTRKMIEWLLDHPAIAAALARHLHPPLEQYRISAKGEGRFALRDGRALDGDFWLVGRGPNRRAYLCQGRYRILAGMLSLSGNLLFAVEYRLNQDGSTPTVEIDPLLLVRLDNLFVRGIIKTLAPILHGIIERRAAKLRVAGQTVGRQITQNPRGLYEEMQTWPDLLPAEREEFRRAFLPGEAGS